MPALALALVLSAPSSMGTDYWIIQEGDDDPRPHKDNSDGLLGRVPDNPSDKTTFDGLMRDYADPNTIVHIGPGRFRTQGAWNSSLAQHQSPGFRLQPGVKFRGAGMQGVDGSPKGTTLLLMDCTRNAHDILANIAVSSQVGLGVDGCNIEVRDLEVNCNGHSVGSTEGDRASLMGVCLWGSTGNQVINVKVANARHCEVPGETETFIIVLNSCDSQTSIGNLIQNCEVSDFVNDTGLGACSAITLNGPNRPQFIQGVVENCRVYLNGYNRTNKTESTANGGEFAYNGARTTSCIYRNNEAWGAQRGFNNDTPDHNSIVFYGNQFHMPLGMCYAYYLRNGTRYSRFYDNQVWLSGSGSSGFRMTGEYDDIYLVHSYGVSSLMLDHNQVWKNSGSGSVAYNLNPTVETPDGWRLSPPHRIHMEYNTNDTLLSNAFPADQAGGYLFGNIPTGAYGGPQPNGRWQFSPARADFNQDDFVDLAMHDASGNLHLRHLGTAAEEVSANPPNLSGWRLSGTGDFNRDGRTDLLWQCQVAGQPQWLYCWYMKGSNLVEAVSLYPNSIFGTWKIAGVADFNEDSKPDLLWQDDSGFASVWYMNGTDRSNAFNLNPQPTNSTQRIVGTGDFNHDGKPDILWQICNPSGAGDSTLVVWFMNGPDKAGDAVLLDPCVPGNVHWRVVATADFDGDGDVDILFQSKDNYTPGNESPGGALMRWVMEDDPLTGWGTKRKTLDYPTYPGGYSVMAPR